MRYETLTVHAGGKGDKHTGAVSTPIYQTSTYRQEGLESLGEYVYSRSKNPTRDSLEGAIALLEGAEHGFAFSSGIAAISSVISALTREGDHIVAPRDLYGGSYRALTRLFPDQGLSVTFADMTDLDSVEDAIRGETKLILIETPSNPLMKITDIAGVVGIAKNHGIRTAMDNTFMTPLLLRPLDLGVDVSIHSATKFIGGHSDVIGGLAVTSDSAIASRLRLVQNGFGAILGPFDSWLLLRGLKTLAVRMERQQSSAIAIALALEQSDAVLEVFYPGLPNHPGREILEQHARGYGAVMAFRAKSFEVAKGIAKRAEIWTVSVSLGGVESILSHPASMSHAALKRHVREELGVSDDLLRLSVGLEDPDDLIEDLDLSSV